MSENEHFFHLHPALYTTPQTHCLEPSTVKDYKNGLNCIIMSHITCTKTVHAVFLAVVLSLKL